MDLTLSTGAVSTLLTGGEVESPVLQIMVLKKVVRQEDKERVFLKVSDGKHWTSNSVLSPELNWLFSDGKLDTNCVIKADKLLSFSGSDDRILVMKELTVLSSGSTIGKVIGNPVEYTINTTSQSNSPKEAHDLPAVVGNIYGLNETPTRGVITTIRDISRPGRVSLIKARVLSKSEIRKWSNARGDGKYFIITLLDGSGEIKMTGFNEAVDIFYGRINVNNVYIFANVHAKFANKQFTSLNHHFEIMFTSDTSVTPCLVSYSLDIPAISFNFVDIAIIELCEIGKIIDVLGIVKVRGDLQTIKTRATNKELQKRDVFIIDQTKTEIMITLWGNQARDFDLGCLVVALKGVKVSSFNGKSLTILDSSSMMINPEISEARELRTWFINSSNIVITKRLSVQRNSKSAATNAPWKLISEVESMIYSLDDAGLYFKSNVTILAIRKENILYKSCIQPGCFKKVTESSNGTWKCEKCQKVFPDFKYRLILPAQFADISDSIWSCCFQEHAEAVLGVTLDDFVRINESHENLLDLVIAKALLETYNVTFCAKKDIYNEETKLKYNVVSLVPVNHREYADMLLREIKENMN